MRRITPAPRQDGLRSLAPELERIIEALARAQEERDHQAEAAQPKRGTAR